jgi:hypothetical protein
VWIRKFDLDQFETMGECRWQLLFPWKEIAQTPFWSGWTHLRPGEKTRKHQHHEIEIYLIARGRGEMRVGDEIAEVGPGDVVYLPPFDSHVLKNTASEDLLFLSIFWEDMKALAGLAVEEAAEEAAVEDEKAVVMAALPPGRGLDLAALGGTWLMADVLARYRRMRGADTRFVSTPVGGEDRPLLTALGLAAEPAAHSATARELQGFFARLYTAGKLIARDGRLWFPLAAYEQTLEAYHLAANMGPRVRAVVERAVALGLDEFAVTQPAGGAVAVRIPGFEGQVFAPALEAFPVYLACSRTPGAAATQFFSAEQSFAFGILYPALLRAGDPEARLPETLVATAPCRSGAACLSGLRGAPGELPADVLRFALARSPEPALDGELAGRWQDWLDELAARLRDEYGGLVPSTGFYTDEQRRFYQRLLEKIREAAEVYEGKPFSLRRVARILSGLVAEAREFNAEEEHWIGVPDRHSERRTSIALGLLAAKILAMISAPLLPDFASRLASALGDPATASRWTEVPDWVPSGSRVDGLAGLTIPQLPKAQEALV